MNLSPCRNLPFICTESLQTLLSMLEQETTSCIFPLSSLNKNLFLLILILFVINFSWNEKNKILGLKSEKPISLMQWLLNSVDRRHCSCLTSGLSTRKAWCHKKNKDNDAQERWVRIMRPEKAMLKFRLPYSGTESKNLDGLCFCQLIWQLKQDWLFLLTIFFHIIIRMTLLHPQALIESSSAEKRSNKRKDTAPSSTMKIKKTHNEEDEEFALRKRLRKERFSVKQEEEGEVTEKFNQDLHCKEIARKAKGFHWPFTKTNSATRFFESRTKYCNCFSNKSRRKAQRARKSRNRNAGSWFVWWKLCDYKFSKEKN